MMNPPPRSTPPRRAAAPRAVEPLTRAAWTATAAIVALLAAAPALAAGQYLTPSAGTSDKPQSKVWYNDGFYWAILQTDDGSHFFQLVDGTWTQGSFIDSHVNLGVDGREDVLWTGTYLFVMVYSSHPNLYKYTYDPVLDVYELELGFPVELGLAPDSETLVIDQDSTGRLWAAYEAGGDIYAAYTTSPDHRGWNTPGIVLRSAVNSDDVAAVIHFAGNRIGVFWSDQNRWEFGFRAHNDGDPADQWSTTEVVYPGNGHSDDHLNLAADSAGRVYAITKDAFDQFTVHRRDPDGDWTSNDDITKGQTGTRPVLMVDASETKLYALYTCWSCGASDPILYRVGSTSSLSFGSATTFISTSGQSLNDVTDMKQILPPGSLLAIASGGGYALWNGWGAPQPGNGFGTDSLPPAPPPPPGPPVGVASTTVVRHPAPGVAAAYLCDEPGGERVFNDADTAPIGVLGAPGSDSAEPSRVAGVAGGALRFDGANDYVEIPSTPELGFTGSFTLEAWLRRAAAGSADVLVAKEGSGRNYRLRITGSDQLELAWKNSSGSSRTTLGTRKLTDLQWHHVAAVHDQERGEDRLYIDGALDARRSDTGRPGACSDPLLLGARRSSGLRDLLGGDLDMVRLSARAAYDAGFAPPLHYECGPELPYVVVSWSPPETGGAPTGYTVYRSTNAEDDVLLTPAAIGATDFADLQPVDGVLAYRIVAANAAGESPRSNATALSFGNGPTPPQPPARPIVRVARREVPLEGNAIYRLDEGQGATSADGSGLGHGLTLGTAATGDAAEPLWVDGAAGGALHFDGVDDRADAADEAALRFTGSFTLEAWVRLDQTGRYGVLLAKESSSAGRNYRLAITSAGKLELQWKNEAALTNLLTSTSALAVGAWHHAAAVFDQTAGESRLYLDGQPAGRAATPGAPQAGAATLRLGARQSSSSLKDFFKGDIDLVRLTPLAVYRNPFTPPADYAARQWNEHLVEWTAATPGSARIAGYRVFRRVDAGDWLPLGTQPVAALAFDTREPTFATQICYRLVAVDRLGLESQPGETRSLYSKPPQPAPEPTKAAPAASLELAVGPNPFNPSTTIALRLDRDVTVALRVYDAAGRVVRTLAHGGLPAGEHRFVWDGRDTANALVASGVYFLRLDAGRDARQLKLVLTK